MKNLISKICLIFTSVLVIGLVQGGDALAVAPASLATPASVDEIFFDKLLAEAGTSRSQINSDELFDSNKGDMRGQNLYLAISNEMMDKPLKEAIKKAVREFSLVHPKTGEAVFFTEDEWRAVYLLGERVAIKTNLGIDSEAIIGEHYDTMIEYVENEIDNFRFVSELKSLSSSTEIATDILIPDLEIMELILFGQVQSSEYDNARSAVGLPPLSTYGDSESADTATHTTSTSTPADTSSSASSPTPLRPRAPADQSFADDKKEFPGQTPESSAVLYNPTGLNPLQCGSDSNIGDAVDDYLENLPPENPFTDFIPPRGGETSDEGEEESEDSTPKKSPTGKKDTSASGSDDDSEVSSEDDFEEIEPAEKHEWINEEFCTEGQKIFCIEVRFINNGQECTFGEGSDNSCASVGFGGGGGSSNTSSGYFETDNCIACHTQFLLGNMDLLLSKTLTPSKAPGNLMESGKCKKSFGKVKPSLNIYAIKKPIPSTNDSNPLFQSSNPFEDFRREMNEGYGFGKGERADAVTKHVAAFSETRSSASIFGEIDDAVKAREAELEFNEEMGILQQQMDTYAKGYKDVSMQIETLNSLVSALSDMSVDINENSCEDLRGKKTCE